MAKKKILDGSVASDEILKDFRQNGVRITRLREALVTMFTNSATPISVPTILSSLKQKKLVVNKTSVYRELEFFLDKKLISEVDFLDGSKRYEKKSSHHHHLVCSYCDHVSCVDVCVNLKPFYSRAQKLGFSVDKHVLELFGRCENCKDKEAVL